VRWRARRDGDLELQGRLSLELRIAPDGIVSLTRIIDPVFELAPFFLRVELEPYFYAAPPILDACDGCGRRRPDATIHFRVAEVGLFRDDGIGTTRIDHDDVSGSCTNCVSCLICTGCASPLAIGTREIRDIDEVPEVLQDVLAEVMVEVEEPVDSLMWFAMAEPAVGGVLLGRLPAVEALVDAETCRPAEFEFRPDGEGGLIRVVLPPEPARRSRDCPSPGLSVVRPGAPSPADTIELLHVVEHAASFTGRENAFVPP
jgi:hypothetical protein